jgi:hypothetical protein
MFGFGTENTNYRRMKNLVLFNHHQDEDSGHRILQDPAGTMWKSRRILRESTGRWKQYSGRNTASTSSGVFPVSSNGMRRKCTGSRRFLPYVFVLGTFVDFIIRWQFGYGE